MFLMINIFTFLSILEQKFKKIIDTYIYSHEIKSHSEELYKFTKEYQINRFLL